MASFEDYDEFGNYIGAGLDSDDEEDEVPQNQFLRQTGPSLAAPLEGYEDETMREVEEEGAMDVDGERISCRTNLNQSFTETQSLQRTTRLSFMRISNTTLQHRTCMEKV
jgi:hypothetical protein